MGAGGDNGGSFITTGDDGGDAHLAELVTVKVYVPFSRPVMVVLVPVPVVIILPGFLERDHTPDAGRPFIITLPVFMSQPGWVIVPGTGAAGSVQGLTKVTLNEIVGPGIPTFDIFNPPTLPS